MGGVATLADGERGKRRRQVVDGERQAAGDAWAGSGLVFRSRLGTATARVEAPATSRSRGDDPGAVDLNGDSCPASIGARWGRGGPRQHRSLPVGGGGPVPPGRHDPSQRATNVSRSPGPILRSRPSVTLWR